MAGRGVGMTLNQCQPHLTPLVCGFSASVGHLLVAPPLITRIRAVDGASSAETGLRGGRLPAEDQGKSR